MITPELLRAHTRALSDDAMQGRRPGTVGGRRTVEYIVTAMRDLGLQPGGDSGRFTQRVPMRAVEVSEPGFSLRVVGPKGVPISLERGRDFAGGSFAPVADEAVAAELVFVGYGITAPEHQWDDYAGLDVRGKVVVAFVGDPPLSDGRFAGEALTYYGRWTYKFERAIEAGAAGCLVIHETDAASYGWNVVETSWGGERFDLAADADAAGTLGVQGWVSEAIAQALARRSGSSLTRWHKDALSPKFRARALGLRIEGTIPRTERALADNNVLGVIPGATAPEQSVIVVAHWDHLGVVETTDDGDGIFNGAIDNASGIAALLGIGAAVQASVARGKPPQRSVVLLASTAEEQGMLGGRYFVDHPTIPGAGITAAVNIDSTNVRGRTKTAELVGTPQSTLEDLLSTVLESQGRSLVPDARPGSGGYYRSDQLSFARNGIVALYFHAGLDRVSGGIPAGERIAAERAARYHTVDDEFDPSWSFEGAEQDAEAVYDVVMSLANREFDPAWRPTSEFASKRPGASSPP